MKRIILIKTLFLLLVSCKNDIKTKINQLIKKDSISDTVSKTKAKTKKNDTTMTESIDSVFKNGQYVYIVVPNGRIDTALMFINDYNRIISNLELKEIKEWVISNENVTLKFKKEYQKIYADALKADPELGLESDPILNAQDTSESGFGFKKMDNEYVIVKAENWNVFNITLKVIEIEGKFLIDGCGIVNIPKHKISN